MAAAYARVNIFNSASSPWIPAASCSGGGEKMFFFSYEGAGALEQGLPFLIYA